MGYSSRNCSLGVVVGLVVAVIVGGCLLVQHFVRPAVEQNQSDRILLRRCQTGFFRQEKSILPEVNRDTPALVSL
jgi:hypothetical protein